MKSPQDDASTRRQNLLLWTAFGLTLLMAPVLILSYAGRPPATRALGQTLNWVVWIGFIIELVLRLAWSSNWRETVKQEWILVTLILLTPPLLADLQGLAFVRLLRLLPLLRTILVGDQVQRGPSLLSRRNSYVSMVAGVLLFITVIGLFFFVFERHPDSAITMGDALWWATVTMTTVGYGDVVPATLAGRLLGAFSMFFGIALTSLITADLAERMMAQRRKRNGDSTVDDPIQTQLQEISRQMEQLTQAVEALQESRAHDEDN